MKTAMELHYFAIRSSTFTCAFSGAALALAITERYAGNTRFHSVRGNVTDCDRRGDEHVMSSRLNSRLHGVRVSQ